MALARYHLGVDFGTCWSKLVLRDFQQRRRTGYVVQPTSGWLRRRGLGYRIPSGVAVDDDTLYFGFAGADRQHRPGVRYYRSLKMRGAFPRGYFGPPIEPPDGLTEFDMCALVVLHLLQIGFAAAKRRAGRSHQPVMGMTLGVPMSLAGAPEIRDRFVELARIAYQLHRTDAPDLSDGLRLDHARDLVATGRATVAGRGPATSWREWVCSEAEAGVLWAFRSPEVPEGLYGCVDVGAGTTDVSFFRIASTYDQERGEWAKDRLAFYSARSDTPGIDAVTDRLVRRINGGRVTVKAGAEHELIERHGLATDPDLCELTGQMFGVHTNAWRDGYRKEMEASRWSPFGLFLLGGGSQVRIVASRLAETVWQQLPAPLIVDPGVPDDLESASGALTAADAAFLLVAYGLSFPNIEVPEAMSPDEMAPLDLDREPERPLDADEYYPR